MLRGEFPDLNGGAVFYAETIEDLRKEGKTSSWRSCARG